MERIEDLPHLEDMTQSMPCPCKSGAKYLDCCGIFHKGKSPETALQLMRSRFSGYVLSLVDYIMATTHRDNTAFSLPREEWKKKISEFSKTTDFVGLTILDFTEQGTLATVTFTASLERDGKDCSFTEKSTFVKEDQRWFYKSGEIYPQKNSKLRVF